MLILLPSIILICSSIIKIEAKFKIIPVQHNFNTKNQNVAESIGNMKTMPITLEYRVNARSGKNHNKSDKEALINYFHNISGSKTISGVQAYNSGSSNKVIETIHNITGEYPGIFSTNMPSTSADFTKWDTFVKEIISKWNDRSLVRIGWYWGRDHPLRNMKIFVETSNASVVEKNWNDLIENGGVLNKKWKNQLDIIIPHLKQLQTAGVITIFDIIPSINQKRFVWSGRPGVDGSMKLYKLTRDYLLEQHKLTSLIWTWSLDSKNLTELEEYWPGSDYVDVASVYMRLNKKLPISEYHRLVNVVGDKPLSMEWMDHVPTLKLLAAQPRWTWFTATDYPLVNKYWNDDDNIKATFNSPSVVNKGSIDFFNNLI